jgi:hypothetical protein
MIIVSIITVVFLGCWFYGLWIAQQDHMEGIENETNDTI